MGDGYGTIEGLRAALDNAHCDWRRERDRLAAENARLREALSWVRLEDADFVDDESGEPCDDIVAGKALTRRQAATIRELLDLGRGRRGA